LGFFLAERAVFPLVFTVWIYMATA